MRKDKRFKIKKGRYGYEAVCVCGGCRIACPVAQSDEAWDLVCSNHKCPNAMEYDESLLAQVEAKSNSRVIHDLTGLKVYYTSCIDCVNLFSADLKTEPAWRRPELEEKIKKWKHNAGCGEKGLRIFLATGEVKKVAELGII